MVESLLHVSDSMAFADGGAGADGIDLGGIPNVVRRAIERDVDAIVHTGNLFRSPDPTLETVEAVASHLADLEDSGIPFFVLEGAREATGDGNAIERLLDESGARTLSSSPTTIGDVALYGVDHVESDAALEEALAVLEPVEEYTYNVVCLHQRIWPPLSKSDAIISAFDCMEATDVFVDDVLAGGTDDHQVWENDDFDYRVTYPGSTNPRRREDDEVPTGTLVEADTDEHSHEQVPLTATDVADEIEQLRAALDHQPADLGGADVETLADLYGLAARAKDLFDERRREVREEILERVPEDRRIQGRYANVSRTTQQRRVPKSQREVFEALRRSGIDPYDVLELDSSALRELSEEGRVADEDVFDREERTYVRVSDTSL